MWEMQTICFMCFDTKAHKRLGHLETISQAEGSQWLLCEQNVWRIDATVMHALCMFIAVS